MAGSGLDDPSRAVTVASTLPTGWSLAGSTDPWVCSTDGSELTCDRSADFGGESESSTTIKLQTDDTATPGPQTLSFTGSVSGPDTEPPSTDDITVQLAVVGAPLSLLRVFHYPTPDTALQIVDGTPLPVAPGSATLLGIDVANSGTIPVPAGTALSFSLEVPAGTTVSEVSGAGLWSCSSASATTVTCTTLVATDLAPAAATPRAKLSIDVADSAATGPQAWPLVISGQFDGQPLPSLGANAQIPVVVATPGTDSPDLGLDVEVVRSPRETFPLGLIEVTPSNGGTAEMVDWSFSVELPAKLPKRDIRTVPETCEYDAAKKTGGKNGTPTITCSSSGPLAAGTSDDTIVIPVWVPGATGEVELLFEASADGAEDVTVPVTMQVLPPLDAIATATPDRVVLPADETFPIGAVLLDGRSSVADGATSTWTQIDNGAPVVTFEGFAEGEPAIGLLTRFTPPTVTAATTLSFQLTLSDDKSSSTAAVDVIIEPADAPQPVATATSTSTTTTAAATTTTSTLSLVSRSTSSGSKLLALNIEPTYTLAAISTGSGSWTWTVPPTFSKNDHDNTIDSPILGSRIRVLDGGTFVWDGPGAKPTDTTVGIEWDYCESPGSCTGDVFIPGGTDDVNAIFTIAGTDEFGAPVTTTETFFIGTAVPVYDAPKVIVPPSISGTPDVGNLLTGDAGEFSIDYEGFSPKTFTWLRCTDPQVASCSPIPGTTTEILGATESTYTVQADDIGNDIRLSVVAYGVEGNSTEAISSAVQSGVTVDCGSDCYTWTDDPIIDRNGAGQPTPITGFTATLVDDGTYAWNDPTGAPSVVTSEVEWFECDVNTPTSCTSVGTGRTHTPTNPDVVLQAELTLSGSFAVDGTVRTGALIVPFGVVRDAALPPVATTLPSISGSTLVGDVLTADPGDWSYSPDSARTYEWFRCAAADPGQCTPVGVTTPTYTVQTEDLTEFASVMRVQVTAPGYVNEGTALSTPSGPLTDLYKRLITAPTIDGGVDGPRVGVEATATQAVWSEMPPTVSGPSLEWQTCTSSDPTSCSTFVWSTDPTFVPVDGLDNRYLRVRATIVGDIPNGGTSEEEAFSDLIGPVLPVRVTASTDLPGGTASIANGEALDVTGQISGGAFPFDFVWTQTSGPSVITDPVNDQTLRIVAPATGTGLLGFRLTVTDDNGETATADITVEYGANAGPAELCAAIDEVRNFDISKNLTYGDVSINFAGGTVTPGPCSVDSIVTITGAFVTAYDFVTISDVTVTINADGITFGGTAVVSLQTGTDLDSGNLALSTDATLTVPFDGDGTYEMVGAVVRSGRSALIDLGFDWTSATRIAFGNAGDVQTISFGAVAWDGSFGPATPVVGQLPTPPAGSPTVTLTGSMGTDKTFSFSLGTTGLVEIAGAGIDFAGTVSRSDPAGGVVFTANGSLAGPVSLADNVVLQSASLTWDGESFGGDGAVTLTVNGDALDIIAAFSFTDPTRWMASVSVNAGGTWSPVSGLDLTNPTISGTLSRNGSDTRINVTIGADAVQIGSGVELTTPSLRLNASCGTGNCGFNISLTTGLTVTMFNGSLSANLSGTLNTSTGAFSASADLGAFTIVEGLSFNAATLDVDKGSSGLAIELTASVNVFGGTRTLTITYDDRGAVVVVDSGTWTPFDGAPTFDNSWLIYSSYATTVTVGGQDVAVGANTLQFSSRAGVPRWFSDLIGGSSVRASVSGTLQLTPLSFDFELMSNSRTSRCSRSGVSA